MSAVTQIKLTYPASDCCRIWQEARNEMMKRIGHRIEMAQKYRDDAGKQLQDAREQCRTLPETIAAYDAEIAALQALTLPEEPPFERKPEVLS